MGPQSLPYPLLKMAVGLKGNNTCEGALRKLKKLYTCRQEAGEGRRWFGGKQTLRLSGHCQASLSPECVVSLPPPPGFGKDDDKEKEQQKEKGKLQSKPCEEQQKKVEQMVRLWYPSTPGRNEACLRHSHQLIWRLSLG